MEDVRKMGVIIDGANTATTFVSMQRLNYIRGLDVHGMAELMDGCTDYCEKAKAGIAQCTETSCVGCIEKWLNEPICVPVILRKHSTEEGKTCEK